MVIEMQSKRFFDISRLEADIKKLTEQADKKFPNRSWFIKVSLWDDGTHSVEMRSGAGEDDIIKDNKGNETSAAVLDTLELEKGNVIYKKIKLLSEEWNTITKEVIQ